LQAIHHEKNAMRKLLLLPLLTVLAGCAPAYTVSQYRTDSANPAR